MEQLVEHWPVAVEDLSIVGHSMGGLVARSACCHAAQAEHRWTTSLKRLVFLGTPHLGAPLERGASSPALVSTIVSTQGISLAFT